MAGFLAAGAGATLSGNPLGMPIGSQTYPHRTMIRDGNFPGLLKELKSIGVDTIELCSALGYTDFNSLADGKQVKTIVGDHGLKCESAHFSMRELRESQEKSIAWAKDVGITQMITATLSGPVQNGTTTMDAVKKAADEYNQIGAVAAKAGIQQGLHNEGFELAMVDGKRVYDVLFQLLHPKLVKFQFQMSTRFPRALVRPPTIFTQEPRARFHFPNATPPGTIRTLKMPPGVSPALPAPPPRGNPPAGGETPGPPKGKPPRRRENRSRTPGAPAPPSPHR